MRWNKLYELGNALESAALSFVVRAGPWLGPIPTAYLVYERTRTHLHLPPWVSVATGLTLEFLGVASSATAIRFWKYNTTKLKSEPPAPTKLALTLTGLYFTAALFLTLVLDTLDEAAKFAPIAFVFLSLAAVSLLALRLAHSGAFKSKAERKVQRGIEKAELDAQLSAMSDQVPARTKSQPAMTVSENGHDRSFEEFERAVIAGELSLDMTGEAVAEWAGKSSSTGRRWLRDIRENGGS
jgi:hypothetical protein